MRLIYRWGVNDVQYTTEVLRTVGYVNGKQKQECIWTCPYYADWKSILRRVLAEEYKKKQPTYIGCTVDESWKYLSNFIKWVDEQPNRDWENCVPDKDLLIAGNKHYSPDTVVYIPRKLNGFVVDGKNRRGDLLLGVTLVSGNPRKVKYQAQCNNPFKPLGQCTYIGNFIDELEAHKAWQAKKHEYACALADLQEDSRVADALRQRYAPDKDWTKF